jgi:glyoxylase-like metal-dependent hydrolase (beta-lactamase superfamily II)/ferredoxin
MARPSRRLATNVDGDFYVDSTCIDCGACRWVAPATFDFASDASRVHTQPRTAAETLTALRALVACPTASIGTVGKHDVRAAAATFPTPVAPDVYHCGYHHEDSFGAASYLIVRPEGNVLVDSPRFAAPLARRLEALGGVRWMFLTHRDDVADHVRFAARFGCERILHRDDVSRSTGAVEIQPRGTEPLELGPDLTLIPVPGHTRGSACLLFRDVLFSGDHVCWSREGQRVTAFRDACWYDWGRQIESMERLAGFTFEHILPGHGAPCHLPANAMRSQLRACVAWMKRRAA